jgi:hypothetical protein
MKRTAIITCFLFTATCLFSQTSVKKVATARLSGTNCDNVVHNTLPPDASNRSASDCEARFDWKIRTAIRNAFQNALLNFGGNDWVISDTAIKPLTSISKATEHKFFDINYYFKIDINPSSGAYKNWAQKFQVHLDELKNPKEDSYRKLTEFNYTMNNAIHINCYVRVNEISQNMYFLKGGQQVMNVQGSAYAVKGSYVAPFSGGGLDESKGAWLVVFGKPKVSAVPTSEGGVGINIEHRFAGSVSTLTVQNISIRVECNNELLDKIFAGVDFKSLAALVGK